MRKRLVLMLLAVFMFSLTAGLAGCSKGKPADSSDAGKVIAEVNGTKITQTQYDRYYQMVKSNYMASKSSGQPGQLDEVKDKAIIDQLKEQAFNNLVLKNLINQDTDKQGIKVNNDEVTAELNQFKQQKNSTDKEGYQKFLQQTGQDENSLIDMIKTQKLYEQLNKQVTKGITVSDDEVKKYYDDNIVQYETPAGVEVYHILVDTEQQADDILQKLKQGADFASMASQYSKDTGSAKQKGYVGVANQDSQWVPEFKTAALQLKVGELASKPVKSQYGYHIIKAGAQVNASTKSLSEVRNSLLMNLQQQKEQQAMSDYLAKLRKEANIVDNRKK